jgi:hypothetical protein
MELMDFLEVQLFRVDPWNCSTLVADWLIECGYPDFCIGHRTITDPVECEAFAAATGGLALVWEAYARRQPAVGGCTMGGGRYRGRVHGLL